MPKTNSIITSVETKTLRRSPRFCTLTPPAGQEQLPTTRRSLRFLHKNDISAPTVPEFRHSHSANRRVQSPEASLGSSQDVSLRTPKAVRLNTTKKLSKPGDEDLKTGLKKSSTLGNGFQEIQTPRRSSRLSHALNIDNALEDRNAKVSKSSITTGGRSSALKNLIPGVRKSPRLNNGAGGHRNIDKSRSFSCQQSALGTSSRDRGKSSGSGVLHVQNANTSVSSRGENVAEGERTMGNSPHPEAIAAKGEETRVVDGEMKKKSVVRRKRKRDDDGVGIRQGWTKEQEAALQRAYYTAKPTPQFWKKVSKLVPGKSAQDCFDKVHSDHLTPPQPRPRSRTQSTKSSQIELLSLSEAKLLNLDDGAKTRKSSRKNQKSLNAQKTVRYLLQKNYHGALSCEADLFSQLEPNINLSYQSPQPSRELSSITDLRGKQGFLHERSSSDHKKPLSRFSSSVETIVVSPAVLKQVKNKALHEKYIDQLHCREAKRIAASKCAKKGISEEKGSKEVHAARTRDLRAARNALISDTRDAIHQLQHLHANAMSKVSDSNDSDDDNDNVDYENEDET